MTGIYFEVFKWLQVHAGVGITAFAAGWIAHWYIKRITRSL